MSNCPVCGENIPSGEALCPSCGFRVRKTNSRTDEYEDGYRVCPDCSHIEPDPRTVNREPAYDECSYEDALEKAYPNTNTSTSKKSHKINEEVLNATGLEKFYDFSQKRFKISVMAALFTPLWFVYYRCPLFAAISVMLWGCNLGLLALVLGFIYGPTLVYRYQLFKYESASKNYRGKLLENMSPRMFPVIIIVVLIIALIVSFFAFSFIEVYTEIMNQFLN